MLVFLAYESENLIIFYVVLFLIYAPPKIRLTAVFLVTQYTMHGDLRIGVVGFIRARITIAMYASPLKRVVMTKSVEYMPFLLSFSLSSSGLIGTCYAIPVKGYSIAASGGTGFVLGTLQLVLLYAIYWEHERPSNNILDELNDGWQHQRLINENNQDV
ncbi:hypothetical protein PVL29_017958 [Vitis rotundifolia]|uniref:Uncharacterized protein n=1 Tax=Vitis rotundifolia TaxID=103349 RepID=A0AA38Z4M4_VITRO|nr:hypothetical protein PVL29_017958 [Vitis rotundifolia]